MTNQTRTNKTPNSTRIGKTIILLLLIICSGIIRGQVYNPANVGYNIELCTGVTPSGPLLAPGSIFNTSVAAGSPDPFWKVNTTLAPGGPSAIVMTTSISSASCSGFSISSNNQGYFPYASWITTPTASCGVLGSGSYSCVSGGTLQDLYFNRQFTLPSTPIPFMVNLQINASDWVQAVYINNPSVGTYSVWNSNSTSFWAPNSVPRGITISVSSCSFQPGTNYIIVHVKTMNPASPMTSPCQFIGMRAVGYVLTGPSYTAITGPTVLCTGATSLYTAPNATAMGYGPPLNTTFVWQTIPSWGGSSTSATLSATAGTNSGVMIASLYKTTPNGKFCLATGGYSVMVPPPLTITPNSSVACAGNQLVLTGNGAVTYTWCNQFGTPIASGASYTTGPLSFPAAYYMLKGTTSTGCVYNKTLNIPVAMSPIVIAHSGTTALCQGQNSVGLWPTGSVGNTYTWAPVFPPTNPTASLILVQPSVTTVFTVTGKSPNGCTATSTINITIIPTPTLVTANPPAICSGTTTTLTATGGTSYTWTPPLQVNTTGSIVVSPSVTTIYTVTATNSNSCTNTMTVKVIVNPSPSFIVNPTSICLGFSNTLIASGAMNYTWTVWPTAFPSNKTVTANQTSVVITPTASMTFSLCSAGSNGCVRCTTSVINMGSPVSLSVSDMTMCTSASNCTNISVNTATTTSCVWQPGSLPGTTVNVCPPSFPATYMVYATSTAPNTCPNQAVMSVYQETNCCSQPTAGLTLLSSSVNGVYYNNSYLIATSQTLTGDTYFRSSEVWITPGVQITVPSGTLLSLEHVHMFACSDVMWKGIKLMDAALLTTPNASAAVHLNSLIEDAEVAVDIDYSLVPQGNANPSINVEGLIFNKNHIGIRMANVSPTLGISDVLNVNGCIFSSRDMPFTTYPTAGISLTWPSSAMTTPGLKVASNSTAGLNPPYIFPNMPQAFTKQPYNTQPGYIGIQLQNLNDPLSSIGTSSTNGVILMNITPGSSIPGDFVLFDGLSYGIDIYEAGLVSKNLVFQNTQTISIAPTFVPEGGDGVRHRMTSLVNTSFELFPSQGNGSFGMRCWDCVRGLNIENVYQVSVPYSIFRSTQIAPNALAPNMPGAYGIYALTNRFNYNIGRSEFNNVRKGISLNTPAVTQNYDMSGNGTNPVPGIFADWLNIGANYFGPEVLSTTAYSGGMTSTSEFMETAVEIITPNTNGWVNSIQSTGLPNGYIYFNKLDRVFRGITIDGAENFPLSVEQNSIYVEDDYTFGALPNNPAPGWGISLSNSTDAKTISTNTLESMGDATSLTNTVALVYCYKNFGNLSPNVHCNFTTKAHYGFEFEDNNANALWGGNHMCNEWAGLALVNNGEIGPQGSGATGCENFWEATPTVTSCSQWAPPPTLSPAKWQTYADNSNAALSPLYVFPSPGAVPTIHGSIGSGIAYSNNPPASIPTSTAHDFSLLDCALSNTIMPNWRMNNSGTTSANQTGKLTDEEWVKIYPNPTSGELNVFYGDNTSSCELRIFDLQGRIVYKEEIKGGQEHTCHINELPASVYILELNKENTTIRKKLIKTN